MRIIVQVVLSVIMADIAYAAEANPIAVLVILPLQYFIILVSYFIIKLGFNRKILLASAYILGHLIFMFAFDHIGSWVYRVPEIIILILPSFYWIVLVTCIILFKRIKVLDDTKLNQQ